MKKCILILLSFFVYILFIVLGFVIGNNIEIYKWTKEPVVLLCTSIGFFIAGISSNIILNIGHKEVFSKFNEVKNGVSLTWNFFIKIMKKFFKFIGNTFEFASILTILFVAFLYIPIMIFAICLFICLLFLYGAYVLLSYVVLVIGSPIFNLLNFIKKNTMYKIGTHLLFSVLTISLINSNANNIFVKIPEMKSRTYSITYILEDDETLVGGKDYYLYSVGLKVEELGIVIKVGYNFEGWCVDYDYDKPFESFGAYEDKGDIVLLPKFSLREFSTDFQVKGYDYSDKSCDLNYTIENEKFILNQQINLKKLGIIHGYSFIGWTKDYVTPEEFINRQYSLIDNIVATKDNIVDNKLTVYAMYVKILGEEIEKDKVIDINKSTDETCVNANGTYVFKAKNRGVYTLVINHGNSKRQDENKADYIEAIVYNSLGNILKIINSHSCGGDFYLSQKDDVYIRFNEKTKEGKYVDVGEHEYAYIMIVSEARNCKSLAASLSNYEQGTKILERAFEIDLDSCLDVIELGNGYRLYNLYNYKFDIVYKTVHGLTTINFITNKKISAVAEVYASVTFYYEGNYVDSGYVLLAGAKIQTNLETFDLTKLDKDEYTMNISLFSSIDLSGYSIEFLMA